MIMNENASLLLELNNLSLDTKEGVDTSKRTGCLSQLESNLRYLGELSGSKYNYCFHFFIYFYESHFIL